jgi:hypothetical protein
MATTVCPHCGAQDVPEGEFCEKCGKALPSVAPTGPRVVTGPALASTAAGRDLQTKDLRKKSGQAFGALLAIAIIQAIFGAVLYFALTRNHADPKAVRIVLAVIWGVGAFFFILSLWARSNPLPAAIVGLVVYVTIMTVDAVLAPETIGNGIVVKILIIAVLIKAVQAGVQYRRLQAEINRTGGGTFPPAP